MIPNIQLLPETVTEAVTATEPSVNASSTLALKSILTSLPEPGHLVRELNADAICNLVAERFDLSRQMLFSRARPNRIVWPRQVAMYLIRELLQWTFEDIGQLFQRDHGTVKWAYATVRDQMESYPKCKAQIEELKNMLALEKNGGVK